MEASGAFGRSLFASVQVATLAALPYDLFFASEDFFLFDVHHQFLVAFLMPLFGDDDTAVHLCDFSKSFFVGRLGKGRIKLKSFFVFACSSLFQIFQCVADDSRRIRCGVADSASFKERLACIHSCSAVS